ncbi:MAG: hypothetical protein JSS56_12170 [Proteobacteria bacterium]|nr:hypothetical protein [Pseudomonadota bacterium]
MFSAMTQVTQMVTPKRRRRRLKDSTGPLVKASGVVLDLSSRPADLRNALLASAAKGTHVVDELVNLGFVNETIEELLCLE